MAKTKAVDEGDECDRAPRPDSSKRFGGRLVTKVWTFNYKLTLHIKSSFSVWLWFMYQDVLLP